MACAGGTIAVVGVTDKPVPTPIVTVAVLDVTIFVDVVLDVSCCATAVMLTWPTTLVPVLGTAAGAVYTPTSASTVEGTIAPRVGLPPAVPFTSQVRVVVVEVLELLSLTTAVKSVCVLMGTVIEVGSMATELTVVEPLPPPQPGKLKMAAATAKKPTSLKHEPLLIRNISASESGEFGHPSAPSQTVSDTPVPFSLGIVRFLPPGR